MKHFESLPTTYSKGKLGEVPYKSIETSDWKIYARFWQEPINIILLCSFLILRFLASLSTIPHIYSLQIKVEMIVGKSWSHHSLETINQIGNWCLCQAGQGTQGCRFPPNWSTLPHRIWFWAYFLILIKKTN